jgi:hypothetical protein
MPIVSSDVARSQETDTNQRAMKADTNTKGCLDRLIVAMLRAGANDAETSTGWGYDRRLWRMNLLMASVPGGWVACIAG